MFSTRHLVIGETVQQRMYWYKCHISKNLKSMLANFIETARNVSKVDPQNAGKENAKCLVVSIIASWNSRISLNF